MRKKSISESLLPRRVAEIGQIKIGGQGPRKKDQKGKPPPVKYDHFVVVTREREDGVGNFIKNEKIHAEVGEKPRELQIWLPQPTPEGNFYSQMQVWEGDDCHRECDGEEFIDYGTGETGSCPRDGNGNGCQCSPFGRLKVILHAAPSFGGEFVFRTHAWKSIRNIQSALEFLYRTFDSLEGLPLNLILYPSADEVEGKKYTNWIVGLVMAIPFTEAAQLAANHHRARRIAQAGARGLIGGGEEPETSAADGVELGGPGSEYFVTEGPEPEEESQEADPDQAPGEDLEKLRAEYHAVLRETIQDDRAKTDIRHAFHQVHPELPDSEKNFTAGHYARALMEVRRWGMEILDKAVVTLAERDPASFEELETLKSVLEASNVEANELGRVRWVINTGVRTWVLRETERLKLNAIQEEITGQSSENGELPF